MTLCLDAFTAIAWECGEKAQPVPQKFITDHSVRQPQVRSSAVQRWKGCCELHCEGTGAISLDWHSWESPTIRHSAPAASGLPQATASHCDPRCDPSSFLPESASRHFHCPTQLKKITSSPPATKSHSNGPDGSVQRRCPALPRCLPTRIPSPTINPDATNSAQALSSFFILTSSATSMPSRRVSGVITRPAPPPTGRFFSPLASLLVFFFTSTSLLVAAWSQHN